MMNANKAKQELVSVVRPLAIQKKATLDRLKQEQSGLDRPDFVWHYLLQSFATMGRAAGWHGLIENKQNYNRVTYETLSTLSSAERESRARDVCWDAKVRMPGRKAEFINYTPKIWQINVMIAVAITMPVIAETTAEVVAVPTPAALLSHFIP